MLNFAMEKKMKLNLITLYSVCCALLYGNVLARDIEQKPSQQSPISTPSEKIEAAEKLFNAVKTGDVDTVKSLIKDPYFSNLIHKKDDSRGTILETVVKNGQSDILDLILQRIQDYHININAMTSDYKTMLTIAAENGDENTVRVLLKYSAYTNVCDMSAKGMAKTPLIIAAEKGYTEIVKMLLDNKKTNLNQQDGIGRTALMLAVKKEHIQIAKMLLDNGAKIDIKDKTKKTASDYAEGNIEMTNLLMEYIDRPENQKKANVIKRAWNKVTHKTKDPKRSMSDSNLTQYGTDKTNDLKKSKSDSDLILITEETNNPTKGEASDSNANLHDEKAYLKNRRLSTDSNATFYDNDMKTGLNINDLNSSTETIVAQ